MNRKRLTMTVLVLLSLGTIIGVYAGTVGVNNLFGFDNITADVEYYRNGVNYTQFIASRYGSDQSLNTTDPVTFASVNADEYFLSTVNITDELDSLVNRWNFESGYKVEYTGVTVDGSYNSEPHLVRCENNDLLIVYRKGVLHVDNTGEIVQKRSTDFGQTWGAEVTIANDGVFDTRNPVLTNIEGNLYLFYRTYSAAGIHQNMYVRNSTDNGNIWSARAEIIAFTNASVPFGKVYNTSNGYLLLAYSQNIVEGLFSTDSGVTWGGRVTVLNTTTVAEIAVEPTYIVLDDAMNNIAVYGREDAGHQLYVVNSSDGGSTWGNTEYFTFPFHRKTTDIILMAVDNSDTDFTLYGSDRENGYLFSVNMPKQRAIENPSRIIDYEVNILSKFFPQESVHAGYPDAIRLGEDENNQLVAWYGGSATPDIFIMTNTESQFNYFSSTIPINSKSHTFQTVQEAIDDLDADGWVYVPPGTWDGVDILDDDVLLFGNGWASILDGGTTDNAVYIQGNRVQVQNLQVKTTTGGAGKHAIETEAGFSYAVIDGVYVSDSDNAGMNLKGDFGWVTNCLIRDVDWASVAIFGDDIVISNNRLQNAGSDGIHIQAGADDIFILGNHLDSFATLPIDNQSVDDVTIVGNTGMGNENRGSVQVFNTNTTVRINHELADTPTTITITPTWDASAFVANSNANNFNVTFTDPTATKTLYWEAYFIP